MTFAYILIFHTSPRMARKCPTCTKKLTEQLNEWTEQTLKDVDTDESIEVMFVSTMEYGASIGNTYFFLSKLGTKIREVYLPSDSSTIWDRCDVLITANPSLLNGKPEGKTTITGVSHGRLKETDRIDTTCRELEKLLENAER